ncbi:peptidoglycan-binding protein [Streptomyces sp. NBC_01426]|uniref:peptidoglycan-binding domain-containing protein n=1 Tax=unclassified Streptomyces TaxID=2593676 RepID=UPI002E2F8B86|nr:peptidoglycan-binding domain-containing protein [Streptomyces sp. NBC_01426]
MKRLQKLLAAQGLYKGKVNGRFDARVKQAVAEFQVDRDVDDDGRGTYGPATRRALEG